MKKERGGQCDMAEPQNKGMTVREVVLGHAKMAHDNNQEFCVRFGIGLKQFWHNLYGFDIVKFDNWLGVPDGVSAADYITEKYGEEARVLVERLIDVPECLK